MATLEGMQGNTNKIQPTDEKLMLDVQKGDLEAFEALYERYHKRLFHFILRFVSERAQAEDILQETFLRLLKGKKRFRKDSRFSTYLFTIARNLCLDTLKSWERRHVFINQENYIERTTDKSKGPDKILEETEMGMVIQNEIQALPPDQREVLILSKYSGLSYAEIAQILESTPAAVKQKAYRAMLSLKQKLKNLDK
jgi:RNA polymerase sigma-70 factor (ECF subfamily)